MQQQLYGKAITPLAKSISPKIEQAQKWENVLQIIIILSFIVSSILSLMLYLLSRYFSGRTRRIEQNLKNTG